MNEEHDKIKEKKSLLAKIGKVFTIFILSLIALVILILILIQTRPVQNFARKKIVSFLQQKLDTKVSIDRLDIDFPKMLVLEGVYIEDQSKDTLIAGGQLKVDIDMFKLLKSELQINEINLNRITAKIKRQLPDTTFNFQFIADAFATEPTTSTTDTSSMKMAIEKIIVDKTRFVFKDVVTGNDVDIYINHFDTRISKFDLNHLAFEVPDINLSGVRGIIKQTKPLEVTTVVKNPDSTVAGEAPSYLSFSNKKTNFSDIYVDYSNKVSDLASIISIKSLNIYPKDINLETSSIILDEVNLNGFNGKVKMGANGSGEKVVKMTDENRQEVIEPLPWKVRINKIILDDNAFKFDDNSQPRLKRGMDFAHLDITDLDFHLQDFYFHNDTISGQVTKGNMSDKSGFDLNNFETKFAYTDKGVALEDLLVRTPGTELKRTVILKYPGLTAIQKSPGLMELYVDLNDSKIKVRDILLFMPEMAAQPAFSNPNEVLYVDGKITGSVARLNIDHFKFRGLKQTVVDVAGTIYGLPDPNNVSANLSIRTFKTSRTDILSLVPPNTIPPDIALPENMALSGTIKGSDKLANADLTLITSFGSAKLKGKISNATNPETAQYNANLVLNKLNVGAIIKDTAMAGLITANVSATGRGFNPDKANAVLKGTIQSAEIKKYTYHNLNFDASIADQHLIANATIKDPNIDLSLQAEGFMGGELPGFKILANIDSIKTQPLNLTPDQIIYKGKIAANFPKFNLDALEGDAFVTNSVLVMNGQRSVLDTISLIASYQNNLQVIGFNTSFLHADIKGKYKIQQLGDVMIETIQPYFAIDTASKPRYVDPYEFTINASLIDHPALRSFVPTLTKLEPVNLTANFSNAEGLVANLTAPRVIMGTRSINDLNLTANTTANGLDIVTKVEEIKSGASIALYHTTLGANLNNNQVNFGLLIKDKTEKNKYRLNGLFAQIPNNNYSLQLRPDSLMLNYDSWSIAEDNLLKFGSDLIYANNFALSQNNQQLIINSTTNQPDSPLEVRFNNFEIATLTAFVETDSLFASGTINGNVLLRNLQAEPNFNTDLTVSNLAINRDTLGNLNAKVNNATPNVFDTDIKLTGNGNDLSLTGKYYMEPSNNNNLDFVLDINKIMLETLEGPSMGMLANASGFISGNMNIKGSAEKPDIKGGITFNQTDFVVTTVNSEFKVDNETIKLDNEGIKFSTFTIKDSANNSLIIDGAAYTTNFTNYKFDMTVNASDFRAINSTKIDNPLYYGQLYFNSSLNIKGTETAPVVDGSLSVNDKTNLSIVIPQPEPGLVERTGVIEFIDMDAPENDSLFMAAVLKNYDSSFNQSQLTGFDVSLNIEISKEAIFNIIVDEGNGDYLRMRGEGLLTGGIDPSGKITLTGTYTVEDGGYNLSFNFLKRKFDIKKGGKITWTGEPTTGTVDVTAVYIANTSPMDLVGDQVATANKNIYLQKLPFEVHLNVTGELLQPKLSFDIVLPTEKNLRVSGEVISTVTTKLQQLESEPSEMNKQVFALLLLNRFISENPFESSGGGGGFNAEGFARQSVSRILTEQLNKLASDLVAGVEINFDINSSEDYSTGEMQNRSDLNVNLSKRLLNDRLRVSVGSNFELDGPQQSQQSGGSNVIGNVTVDYMLTKDGRFMLRGYRKNDYEAIVEGFVIETGLKFIMTVDYNKFREIFENMKARREIKKAQKAAEDSTSATTTSFNYNKNNPGTENTDAIESTEKISADNRKNIPVVNKDESNEK